MSHAGPPSDPPPGPTPEPEPEPVPEPEPEERGDDGEASDAGPAERRYNPYPDNWDTPTGPSREQGLYPPPDPSTQASPPGPSSPYGEPSPYGQPEPYGQPSPYGEPSPYGQPEPYGQQSPYAAPGPPGSPANPYAGPAKKKPTFGFGGYAGWFTRVGGSLIDGLLGTIAALPLWIGYAKLLADASTSTDANGTKHLELHSSASITALIWIGIVTSGAFQIWNVYIRQGRTGATYGKTVMAIRLVNPNRQPIGAGWAFVRQIVHVVDWLPCGLGWFAPLWDSRNQTFADKIMGTLVINATTRPPGPLPPEEASRQLY